MGERKPLVLQPDFGQTMLIVLVWGALFFMAGMRLVWVAGLGGIAAAGLSGAYFTVPHVARRIQRFMDPSSGDTFNIDYAMESFVRGGWLGRGPGEGTIKRILPESHTDFVFAVAAEEFGIVLCLMLLALFAFIVIRALRHASRSEDPFIRFATAGLSGVPVSVDFEASAGSRSNTPGSEVAIASTRAARNRLARPSTALESWISVGTPISRAATSGGSVG